MSLKTKILGLFKYDPDKDGASTINIKQALNDNWDKLDNEVAARVKTTELASEVKKTVKGGGLTAPELGAEKAGAINEHNTSAAAHAALFKAINAVLAAHVKDTGNPHKITPAQIGAIALTLLGQPNGPAVLDKDGRLTADQLGGMIGGESDSGTGELQDTEMEVGTITNTGAGWNTYHFREAFEGIPQVVCQAEDFDGVVLVKDITAEKFLYCLRKLQTGSYYTGDSTGTNPSHSAATLVNGTTTTADAIKINYVAIEYGGER